MTAKVRLVVAPWDDLPARYRQQVLRLHAAAWPASPTADPPHDPALAPTAVVLVDAGDEVLASLELLTTEIDHRDRRYRVVGLSAVTTRTDVQGRGHGSTLIRAARLAARDRADLTLFSCDPPLVAFYERGGFRVLAGTSLIGGTPIAPLDSASLGKVVLGDAADERLLHAVVGDRIELYPGDIDRLF